MRQGQVHKRDRDGRGLPCAASALMGPSSRRAPRPSRHPVRQKSHTFNPQDRHGKRPWLFYATKFRGGLSYDNRRTEQLPS